MGRNLKADARQPLFEPLRHPLRTDPEGVARVIERLQLEVKGRRAPKMKTAIAYFEKQAARMAYVALDAQHLPVGSGTVESAVRRIINLRFKAAGTFWEEETVAGLMHLRACFKAGRWEELMERVLTQTFQLPSFEPLTSKQVQPPLSLEPQGNTSSWEEIPLSA